jgi:peptidoglycan-associated lipoprotein
VPVTVRRGASPPATDFRRRLAASPAVPPSENSMSARARVVRTLVLGSLAVSSLAACRRKPTPVPTPAGPTAEELARRDSLADAERERARRDSLNAARERAVRDSLASAQRQGAEAVAGARATLTAPVYFDYDAAALRDDTRQELEAKLPLLTANPSVRIRVAGHTDERGSDEYNLALGQRRAASVKGVLRRARGGRRSDRDRQLRQGAPDLRDAGRGLLRSQPARRVPGDGRRRVARPRSDLPTHDGSRHHPRRTSSAPRRARRRSRAPGAACVATRQDVQILRGDIAAMQAWSARTDSARARETARLLDALGVVRDTVRALAARDARFAGDTREALRTINEQLLQVQELSGQSQRRLQELRALARGAVRRRAARRRIRDPIVRDAVVRARRRPGRRRPRRRRALPRRRRGGRRAAWRGWLRGAERPPTARATAPISAHAAVGGRTSGPSRPAERPPERPTDANDVPRARRGDGRQRGRGRRGRGLAPNGCTSSPSTTFRRGHGGAARTGFADLLRRFPTADVAPEAQFYVAESWGERAEHGARRRCLREQW